MEGWRGRWEGEGGKGAKGDAAEVAGNPGEACVWAGGGGSAFIREHVVPSFNFRNTLLNISSCTKRNPRFDVLRTG